MVEKNIRLKTHLGNGVYDTLHPETNSGIVRVGDKNLDETLGKVTAQLAQITNIYKDASLFGVNHLNVDNSDQLQEALNSSGVIVISKPGIYMATGLVIGDNTTLKLMDGVTLKQKDNANGYLLKNSGATTGIENVNITLDGGKWDFNGPKNPVKNAFPDYNGSGFLFNHVRNLKIINSSELGNAIKYTAIFANITNGEFYNLNIKNISDGLHFQAPCSNIKIDNITGACHDNMIAFTIGDYNAYVLSNNGDFENIDINNVHSDLDTPTIDVIRFVGAGLNNKGESRNVKINNISGNSGSSPLISVLPGDQAVGNLYLKHTIVKNLEINNIYSKTTKVTAPALIIGGEIENLTIKNVKIAKDSLSTNLVSFNKALIDNVELSNISIDPLNTESNYFINTTEDSVIGSLTLNNVKYNTILNAVYYWFMQIQCDSKIRLVNCDINVPERSFLLNKNKSKIKLIIDSSTVKAKTLIEATLGATILLKLSMSEINKVSNIPSNRLFVLGNVTTLRVESTNTTVDPSLDFSGAEIPAKISVNGAIPYNNILARLTPKNYDFVHCVDPANPLGVGMFYYNGTSWVKNA